MKAGTEKNQVETINFVEWDLICVSVFFSSVQWEGAGRGGDSSSSAACPQVAWFNVKPLFGICFSGPVNSSEGREAASPRTRISGRDRLSWDTLYCSCELWLHTLLAKADSDGFHGRDNLEGEKVLVQSILVHTFLRHSSSSRLLGNAGRIGNVLKNYYFCLVYGETEVGKNHFSLLFYWKSNSGMEAFGNTGIFRQAVPTHVKCF